MAFEVEKWSIDVPLSVKAKINGRWNFTELEMDYPDLVSKVDQLSVAEDMEPLSREPKDEDSVVVEGTGHTVPGLSPRNKKYHKLSLMPSNRFCKIKAKAKYVERQPLIRKATYSHDVPQHFSRSGLHPDKSQFGQLKTECPNSTGLLQGLQELPAVHLNREMDSKFYSLAPKSLHNLDTDCNTSQTSFTLYSSTPNHLSGNRAPHFDAAVSRFLKTSRSLQPPEDTDCEQQGITRSENILIAGVSASCHLPCSSDPKENSLLGTQKLIPMDNHLLVGQGRKMSSYQADYWACAIPDSLPPSPDRQSPHWNPNKEYEDLLDYTYPLRPKYKLAKNPKGVHNSSVHDSGIDLESLSISPESTLKSMSMQGQEHSADGIQSTVRFSDPLLKKSERSVPVSPCRISPVGRVSFADGSPSTGMSRMMMHNLSPKNIGSGLSDSISIGAEGWDSRRHDVLTKCGTPHSFIRSTKVLPLQQGCSSDEEYLTLPPRLKELETLAQQLTDISLTLRKPGHGFVQDRYPCISVNGEVSLPEVHGNRTGKESLCEMRYDSALARSSWENSAEDLLSDQGFRDHGSTQKETASTDTFETQCLEFLENESHHVIQGKDHYRDSLAECIKLEELICWLHKVAEVTDNWIPPKPDIENVKTSLQSYLEFKKDLARHQALTGSVLQNGERLLKCMASNSPILQNTLGLIAKQAEELEKHAERLYESVLAAIDSLGTSLKNCDAQTAAQVESSKWAMPIDGELVGHSLEE